MGKFDGILLLSDMDGTLLNEKKCVSAQNQQAIDWFIAEGGHFCMATGRPPLTTTEYENLMPQSTPRVYLNGALVRNGEGRVFRSTGLDQGIWQLIHQVEEKFPQAGCELFTDSHIYLYRTSEVSMQHQQMAKCEFDAFSSYQGQMLYKVIFTGPKELLRQIEQECADLLERYEAASSTPTFLEVTAPCVNKGKALQAISDLVQAKRTYAIGDSGNDLSMLVAADFSFAPQNADAEILQAADQVVRSNVEHAVAHAIEQIAQQIG